MRFDAARARPEDQDHVPQADEKARIVLTDFLPAGFECGALNGKVELGSSVAIVGSGPIGLAVLLTAQFYSPFEIILIDIDDDRLAAGSRLGATATVNSAHGDAAQQVMLLTGGRGVDTAIEAVGFSVTFQLCQDIVAPGGTIAHAGMHGTRHGLHAQRSGAHKIMITPGLVDALSAPIRRDAVQPTRLGARQRIIHRVRHDPMLQA